jgi:uncharacterized repeat protein (TIGR01451 family)
VTFTVPASTQPGPQTNTVTTTSTTPDSNPNNNTATDTDIVQTSADLAITKSDGVTVVTAGDGITYTYTVTVHNNGPSDAQGVSVSDTWPSGFTQGTISDPFGTVTQGSGGNFTATLGTIASGASKSITVTFTVPASTQPGPQTNTVTTTSTTTDTNPNNNTATDTDVVISSSDLSIQKTDNVGGTFSSATNNTTGGTIIPGLDNAVVYTIVVSNKNGPSTAFNQTVTDLLTQVPGMVSESWTASASAGSSVTIGSGNSDINDTVTLLPGGTVTFTVHAVIHPATSATGPVVNTATVTQPSGDNTPSDNTSSDFLTLTPQEILGVKFEDLNQDGIWEQASEPALPGWIINLQGPNGLTETTTTDANGAYEFDALPQGNYTLSEQVPTTHSTASVAASPGPVVIPVENTGIFIVGEPVMVDQGAANAEIQFVVGIDPGKSITVGKLNFAHNVDAVIAPSMVQTTANPAVTILQGTVSRNNNFGNAPVASPLHAFPACFEPGQLFEASNTDESTSADTLLIGAGLNTTGFRISQISGNGQTKTVPAGGSATLNLPNGTLVVNSDGTYTYTASLNPANPSPGPADTFQYKILNITSGQETAAQNGTLPPVDLPLVVNDVTIVINSAGEASGNVLGTDRDPDGDTLTVSMVGTTSITSSPTIINLPHGVLRMNPNGTFTYKHNIGDASLDSITYTATDGNGCTGTALLSFRAAGSLSGFAYLDLNNDGIKESNERGIANVRIKLYRLTPIGYVFVRSVLTNSLGKYKFSNLGSGTFKVAVVRPTGFRSGKVSVGSVRGLVDGLVSGDPINDIVLGAGDNGINYNFAFLPSKSIFFA